MLVLPLTGQHGPWTPWAGTLSAEWQPGDGLVSVGWLCWRFVCMLLFFSNQEAGFGICPSRSLGFGGHRAMQGQCW